tara:strand:- start:20 stop:238 length:219 start_codon:yes stop_codon:yes gene_type:complete
MSKILLNKDGVTVGQLKRYLEGFDNDMKVSDTQVHNQITYSSRITELLIDNEGVAMISQMSRDHINKNKDDE